MIDLFILKESVCQYMEIKSTSTYSSSHGKLRKPSPPILLPDFEAVKKEIEENGTTLCEWCNAVFVSSDDLVNHVKKHTGGKQTHHCEDCSESFSSALALLRHANKLHARKATKCSVCQTVFVDRESCRAHLRVHQGREVFTCKECSKVALS